MSTRAMIFQELENGKTKGIYVHSDGYVNMHIGVGVTLWNNYEDREKVSHLLKLGDLSTLGDSPEASFVIKHFDGFSWYHNSIISDLRKLEEQAGYHYRYTDTHIHYERNSNLASGSFRSMDDLEIHDYLYSHAKKLFTELKLNDSDSFHFIGNSTPYSELEKSAYNSTIAYARDRGEELSIPLEVTINELSLSNNSYSDEEFQYLQKLNGDWFYRSKCGSRWSEWLDLNNGTNYACVS